MRALLQNLLLGLDTNNRQVQDGWQTIFDYEIKAAAARPKSYPDIRLAAVVASDLPQPPNRMPPDEGSSTGEQGRRVRYTKNEGGGFLDLARPASIRFNFSESEARITFTQELLNAGNLEDLTLIALAPFLRRRGTFLLHAFAAARDTAVLLCGPPGSGKTTTGLALLQKGWRYLANDAALLRLDEGQVRVYPSPGAINLHPQTLALLPHFQDRLPLAAQPTPGGKYTISRGALLAGHEGVKPTAVGAILFPRLSDQSTFSLHEVNSAVGLARLIEENVDQWDSDTYEASIDLLAQLSHQAAFYDLHLPRGQAPDSGLFDALHNP
jgi:hypothetical protein